MILAGKTIRFWLSTSGRQELAIMNEAVEPIDAFVVEQDALGAWIQVFNPVSSELQGVNQAMLLKWDHFSTAITDFQVPEMAERLPVGFKP
jgi:hypothetical protein